ncbi:MAG: alpha-L-fucosidase [Candidatus Hydrogenedentes bacterium]|nr:alpha-L-fucosidase [Candidatus Hydrogenedentota bacterium]
MTATPAVFAAIPVLAFLMAQPVHASDAAPLLPCQETPAQRDARLALWREARFGMFIHWGPASVNGTEISWSRIGHPHDHPGLESVPAETYDALYRRFNPAAFDADAWMQLAKDAGMKYVVFVAKHHDGFSMWPTRLRPEYSIRATPFARDICKEIADAAHAHGLMLGWYYSTRDWTHPDYLAGDNRKYDAFYREQVRELITDYGRVDILWFDHVAGNWRDYDFQSLFDMLYLLQPGIVVNDRAARFIRPTEDAPSPGTAALTRGDFDTPEQKVGTFQRERPWESCITMTECKDGGGWSYRPDGRTRSLEECIRMLVSCVCGDGNLLLNAGPMPTGEILPEQAAVLRQIGAWLGEYGESIYGTRGGPYRNGAWGGATYKGRNVYLHVFRRDGGTLSLPRLKAGVVTAAALTGGNITWELSGERLRIALPPAEWNAIDTIIKLELDGPADNEIDIEPLQVE